MYKRSSSNNINNTQDTGHKTHAHTLVEASGCTDGEDGRDHHALEDVRHGQVGDVDILMSKVQTL